MPIRARILGGLLALVAFAAQADEPLDWPQCIAALKRELPSHPDLSPLSFDTYTRGAQDLRPMIEQATQAQPEFKLPIWDYLARRVDAQRIAQGRELLAEHADTLAAIQRRHGIDGATVVAVFGIETDYGRVRGKYPVVDATLSRACLKLDSTDRKNQFFAALWMLQEGLAQPQDFVGSWAGAFGMTQMLPGNFLQHMEAADGRSAPDVIHQVGDALATTARYLHDLGWRAGMPWGVEVAPPAELPAGAGEHACLGLPKPGGGCRTLHQWAELKIVGLDGKPLVAGEGAAAGIGPDTPLALLMPAGAPGPAWLVTPNYQAVWRYNRADAYALAIHLLADALRGAPPQRTPWPTDDPGLSRAELRELQGLLVQHGHCEIVVDGQEGPLTAAAIRAEEQRRQLPETGRAGGRILGLLRKDAPAAGACAGAASAPR